MALNFPGPYEIELFYSVSGLQHVAKYNCDVLVTPTPGDSPSVIELKTKDGASTTLYAAVAAWTLLMAQQFNTTMSFDYYNFWCYVPGTFDKTFITTAASTQAGLHVNPTVISHQTILTFRTLEGGIMKIAMLDDCNTNLDRNPYATAGVPSIAMMDFVVSGSNWLLGRDTSYPIAPLNELGGENEALFKIRHR